jgi:hypothetical protein
MVEAPLRQHAYSQVFAAVIYSTILLAGKSVTTQKRSQPWAPLAE